MDFTSHFSTLIHDMPHLVAHVQHLTAIRDEVLSSLRILDMQLIEAGVFMDELVAAKNLSTLCALSSVLDVQSLESEDALEEIDEAFEELAFNNFCAGELRNVCDDEIMDWVEGELVEDDYDVFEFNEFDGGIFAA
jgi:hypothetical protein